MTSKPFERIAADANVLASAAVGRAAIRVFGSPARPEFVTTEITIVETRRVVAELATYYRLDRDRVIETLENFPLVVYAREAYEHSLQQARRFLGKRDPSDVDLAALALALRIPVWSNDHDFEELPLPMYPTARLLKLLGL